MIRIALFNLIFYFSGIIFFILAVVLKRSKFQKLRVFSILMIFVPMIAGGIMQMFFTRHIYFIDANDHILHKYILGFSCNLKDRNGRQVDFDDIKAYQCIIVNNSSTAYTAEPLVYVSDPSERTVEDTPVTINAGAILKIDAHQLDYMPGEPVPQSIMTKTSGTNYRWALKKSYNTGE